MVIRRTYQSVEGEQKVLGDRWRLNWKKKLTHFGNTITLNEESGILIFSKDKTHSEYISDSGEKIEIDTRDRAIRTKRDGTREIFDKMGRLIETDLRNGNKVLLHFNSDGRLSRIDGPKGQYFKIETDSSGHIIRVSTSSGSFIRYTYQAEKLTEVQVNEGPIQRYQYDEAGNLISIEEPLDGTTQLAYDPSGRVLSRTWADQTTERYEYEDSQYLVRHIDPEDSTTTTRWSFDYHRQEVIDPLNNKTITLFDSSGRNNGGDWAWRAKDIL